MFKQESLPTNIHLIESSDQQSHWHKYPELILFFPDIWRFITVILSIFGITLYGDCSLQHENDS